MTYVHAAGHSDINVPADVCKDKAMTSEFRRCGAQHFWILVSKLSLYTSTQRCVYMTKPQYICFVVLMGLTSAHQATGSAFLHTRHPNTHARPVQDETFSLFRTQARKEASAAAADTTVREGNLRESSCMTAVAKDTGTQQNTDEI